MPTDRKLTYSRRTKDIVLLPEMKPETEPQVASYGESVTPNSALKGYEKTDGMLSYSIVCVISGGERKEKDFLRELIRHKELHSLRVAFISKEKQGLQPYQMDKVWSSIKQSGEVVTSNLHYQLDKMDKVFLLTDVDEFYEQIVKIRSNQDGTETGQWIISNPCFEIWLYYSFKNSPNVDLASIEPLVAAKRSQEMKHLGNKLIPGGLNPLRAFENMPIAITHSRQHYAEDEKSIPVLYATQMHEMAQYLIDIMNRDMNEYDEFVRKKQEWRKKMQK